MGLIRDLIPLNLQEEKTKFFGDQTYNPQFDYSREFTDVEMSKYGLPHDKFYEHSRLMISKYGLSESNSENPLSPAIATNQLFILISKLGLPKLSAHFESELNSQIMFDEDGLRFRTPIKYSAKSLRNKLNHEIQTHFLRRYNQQLQTWDLDCENRSPREFRLTEEGLANLHSYIERPDQIFKKTYLNYFASYLAQKVSFSELYSELIKIGCTQILAWNLTVKQKRGLNDTSQPGGFSKNHIYFEGLVKVWQWIVTGGNPKLLYAGRVSIEEIHKIEKLEINSQIIYPTFFADIDKYHQKIIELGEANLLDKLEYDQNTSV